jgi:aminoglycoside phosphotransferase (APT) family kinase protein
VFRFPQRAQTAPHLAREIRWLPALAGKLPIAVPQPAFVGAPTAEFSWPFMGHRHLPGQTACALTLSDGQQQDLAAALGTFLAHLHSLPVPDGLPREAHARTDPGRLLDALSQRQHSPAVLKSATALKDTAPWRGPPVWVHGDLYGRHLLLSPECRLCGVIDWGDLHAGDAAADLAVGFMQFTGRARARFLSTYGEVDAATLARARLRALYCCTVLTALGQGTSDGDLLRLGQRGLVCAQS